MHPFPGTRGDRGRPFSETGHKSFQPLEPGSPGWARVSLPPSRGQALIAFFRGLCAACSFILGPTQCRGERRSDFQPSALDFLSFVGWRTDYATRLPVISAPGVAAPWRRASLGDWEMPWEVRTEAALGCPSLCLLLDSEDFSRSLVIENVFLWDLDSDRILKATCNTVA